MTKRWGNGKRDKWPIENIDRWNVVHGGLHAPKMNPHLGLWQFGITTTWDYGNLGLCRTTYVLPLDRVILFLKGVYTIKSITYLTPDHDHLTLGHYHLTLGHYQKIKML